MAYPEEESDFAYIQLEAAEISFQNFKVLWKPTLNQTLSSSNVCGSSAEKVPSKIKSQDSFYFILEFSHFKNAVKPQNGTYEYMLCGRHRVHGCVVVLVVFVVTHVSLLEKACHVLPL